MGNTRRVNDRPDFDDCALVCLYGVLGCSLSVVSGSSFEGN